LTKDPLRLTGIEVNGGTFKFTLYAIETCFKTLSTAYTVEASFDAAETCILPLMPALTQLELTFDC